MLNRLVLADAFDPLLSLVCHGTATVGSVADVEVVPPGEKTPSESERDSSEVMKGGRRGGLEAMESPSDSSAESPEKVVPSSVEMESRGISPVTDPVSEVLLLALKKDVSSGMAVRGGEAEARCWLLWLWF